MALDDGRHYFEFLAKLGLTKHMGSMDATRRLVELCHIEGGEDVLDVGTGVGATPAYLVKALGCHVFGVDLLEEMVQQARQEIRAHQVGDRVALAAADARRLPFADGSFDTVIMESLNVFFDDKLQAMRGYVRVAKPGGHVGLTEMTWLSPPSPEKAAYYRRTVYADALQAEGWMELLEEAGLQDVVGYAQPVEIAREGMGRLERYGCRGIVGVLLRTVRTVFKDRASRVFLKDVMQSLPQDFVEDVGYGVYAGRKG
ncbi:MAG: class I SAM-dependent methyltransferase [Anaerolineae bacterium]|nr:class I SAM-dependent methyltransferase [Anaerolineae bacterium]